MIAQPQESADKERRGLGGDVSVLLDISPVETGDTPPIRFECRNDSATATLSEYTSPWEIK